VIGDLLGEEGALGFVSDQGQRLPDAAERGLTPDALATLRVLSSPAATPSTQSNPA